MVFDYLCLFNYEKHFKSERVLNCVVSCEKSACEFIWQRRAKNGRHFSNFWTYYITQAKHTPLTYRFSMFVKSLINFHDRVDFKVTQRLGLWFYHSKSLMLFCSPLHAHFNTIKHLLLALVLKKLLASLIACNLKITVSSWQMTV